MTTNKRRCQPTKLESQCSFANVMIAGPFVDINVNARATATDGFHGQLDYIIPHCSRGDRCK